MYRIINILLKALLAFVLLFLVMNCETDGPGVTTDIQNEADSLGILDVYFVFSVQGVPPDRLKRADLSLAYSADSMYRGEFFTAKNVSDAISKYRFYLPPGEYFYHATLICLARGDSCSIAQFGGQYGLRMDGGKVELEANKLTEVTTQFH